MNSKVIVALVIIASTCAALSNADAEAVSEAKLYAETKTVPSALGVEIDPTRAITAYDYRAMMLRSIGTVMQCWRCSSPCSAYACCNDGYPQCCLVNGRCMCCRF